MIRRDLLFLLILLPFYMAVQSCTPADDSLTDEIERPLPPSNPEDGEEDDTDNDIPMNRKLEINIGAVRYTATLDDSPTARAFTTFLPMTIVMTEMNGNEKYYNLSASLPVATFRPGTIHAGDLFLWGTNTVVLFYETFSSSYSYTRLGKIDNPDGLDAALGSGNVTVTFSAQ